MKSLQLKIHLFAFLFTLQFSLLVNAKTDPADLNFYTFKQPIQAPIFVKNREGNWIATGQTMFFREGQYFKVDGVATDGTLWVKSYTDNGYEVIGITPELTRGEALKSSIAKPEAALNGIDTSESKNKVPIVEHLESGSGNIIRRWMGHKGIEDVQVYFDAPAGKRVALMSEPGGNRCDTKAGPNNPCQAWPSTDDELQIVDSTVKVVADPITGQKNPKLYYKVKTTYCPSGPKDRCSEPLERDKVGWIEARRVSPTKREIPPGSAPNDESEISTTISTKPKLEKPCPDPITNQARDLGKIAKAADNEFDKNYTWKIGQCLTPTKGKTAQDLTQGYFSEAKKRLNKISPIQSTSPSATAPQQTTPTDQQIYEIDVLARTLFGEMRSCSEQSPAYYKAVARVLLNRAAIVKSEGFTPPFVHPKSSSTKPEAKEHQIVADVASSPLQISSWNAKDPNVRVNLCPGLETKNPEGKDAWKQAVRVAWQAVMHKDTFIKETKDITHTHYTSGMIPSWSREKKREVSFKIDGKTYSNSHCLILWADGSNKKIERLDDKPYEFVGDSKNEGA